MAEVVAVIYCEPCIENDERNDAVKHCNECDEYLCFDCVKTHKKMKATQHHRTIYLEDMERAQTVTDVYRRSKALTSHKYAYDENARDKKEQEIQVGCIGSKIIFVDYIILL